MLGLALLAVLLLASFLAGRASAQDRHEGHMQYHEAYKNWCMPGHDCREIRSLSCCDGRTVTWRDDGTPQTVLGHCYPTEFRPNPTGQTDWIARLSKEDAILFQREWIEVLDSKFVREKNPDETGRAGHLCTDTHVPNIRCARPPSGVN